LWRPSVYGCAIKLGLFFQARPFPIQSSTSTMASPEETIPYIHVDPSTHLRSLFDLYDVEQDVKPYDWSKLFNKAIKHYDLYPLVVSIGLLLDRHALSRHPTKFRHSTREFCCPTCAQFHLVFKCSRPQPTTATVNYFLLESEQSGHSADCPTSTCITESCVLVNLPSLMRQMRTVELEPSSAGRAKPKCCGSKVDIEVSSHETKNDRVVAQ
jgi:hypothetical protein